MPTFNGEIAEFFRDHHGIASHDELYELDIGEQERRQLIDAGVLLSVFEGVYRLASSPLTFHARCRAVCAADPSLTLSCFTSGALLDLRRCGNPWIHAVTDRLTKPISSGVKLHRTRLDLAEHTICRDDGIRHTDAVQTFFDLAKHVNDLDLRSIGEQMIADGLATHQELLAHVGATSSKGRPGSGRAIRVIGSRVADGAAADSHGEVVLFDALHDAGLTDFVRHPEVRLRDGSVVHPDMGVPELGFFVEVDHHAWHTQADSVEYDKWRDRQIRLSGGEVERVPTSHIERSLVVVLRDLTLRYHQRRALVGVHLR
jgi:hypothetical protein